MNVDPNAPAVQFRTGDFLKRKFYESRASFTQWRMNWSQRGNYDVDSFERYVAQPPPGSTSFPTVSLCAIILFHTTRCGERDAADVMILEWVAKAGEGDCMYDDLGGDEPGFTGSSQILSKKRRANDSENISAVIVPHLQGVSRSMAAFASGEATQVCGALKEVELERLELVTWQALSQRRGASQLISRKRRRRTKTLSWFLS
jgi:hypothetical protein